MVAGRGSGLVSMSHHASFVLSQQFASLEGMPLHGHPLPQTREKHNWVGALEVSGCLPVM